MQTALVRMTICLILLAQPLTGNAEVAAAVTPYIMGVFPFVPTTTIEGIFAPLAAELSQALGRPVKVRSASSFDKFTDELKNRVFDIAFIQPFDYASLAKSAGLLPLASRNEVLNSYIVVRNDSPVHSMKDLKGKNMGMPPKAAAVSFLNSVVTKEAGLTPNKDVMFVFLASHQACLQQLMIGNVAACGVSPTAVRLAELQLKTTFRLIKESPAIPTPLFVVKKELPQKDRDTMLRVLITTDLAGVSPELRNKFVETNGKPFRKATDREYDVIRTMMHNNSR
ncbi:MAG: phosphate/phosphite/phosphonate ABC transporter substrate-binding protein [Desulfuromonadaceae bacterium]|nr:phosphate/phosphite/phosphonate ABC transporter substrate-binding protein [Desulfuromonadaceae bacterium]MDD2847179.1 phosphate/phosphite/phosphonate ABC transporter substrate-binding protein [Desulfuromonadaceae bacterium]MDD4130123.1 phosphate/phosphite/phosphonate ABC transporter substrate-binding protein [Desulfuromonadaceae bacterium]